MRKIFTGCLAILFCLVTYSQENANRMIIHKSSQNAKGYMLERVDSVTFAQAGRAAAEIEVIAVDEEKATVNITRTPECMGFKLECMTKLMANQLTNDAVASDYIDQKIAEVYYEDFNGGQLTGANFKPDTEYTLFTLGIDGYNTACEVCRATFRTPKVPLIGNPKVKTTVTDVKEREFTASFEPNEDVSGYAVVAGKKGELLAQYEQMGAMFGFNNFGDMIKSWGVNYTETASFTWTEMEPNTVNEIMIQAWDQAGTYVDVDTVLVTTKMKGGTGAAVVEIQLGEYKMTDWDGEMKGTQSITFVPNDQTNCFRMDVYKAVDYDKDTESIQNYLKSDPPMPIADWFQYETFYNEYQIDPNTACVAIAIAKNGEGKWGEFTVVRFTTPTQVPGMAPATSVSINRSKIIRKRIKHQPMETVGKAPQLPSGKNRKLQLIKK